MSVCFVFCTVTDFSAAEKARGVKFCMSVGLLSGQVFSPFGEHWLAGSHGGGGISRRLAVESADHAGRHPLYKPELNRRFVRLSSMVTTVGGHWELRAAALLKTVWWGLRLASLLTHLFIYLFSKCINVVMTLITNSRLRSTI